MAYDATHEDTQHSSVLIKSPHGTVSLIVVVRHNSDDNTVKQYPTKRRKRRVKAAISTFNHYTLHKIYVHPTRAVSIICAFIIVSTVVTITIQALLIVIFSALFLNIAQ